MKIIKLRTIQLDATLRQAARHVSYEIRMLVFTAKYLDGCRFSPLPPSEGDLENVALESFLLHFRNLRSFLCPPLGSILWSDDIFASDFLKMAQPQNVGDKRKLARYRERVDKMLTHLSSARGRFIEANSYPWPVTQMLLVMLNEVAVFYAALSPEMKTWFPTADEFAITCPRRLCTQAAMPVRLTHLFQTVGTANQTWSSSIAATAPHVNVAGLNLLAFQSHLDAAKCRDKARL